MNDRELDQLLDAIGADNVRDAAPPDLRARVRTVSHTAHSHSSSSPFDRRLQTMFSASKYVVAGVIVAVFGSFLLAGVLPTEPDRSLTPAAESQTAASVDTAVEFSGRVNWWRDSGSAGNAWRVWEMSDPRLEGEWTSVFSEAFIASEYVPDPRIIHASFRVENEGGSWQEQPGLTLEYPDGSSSTRTSLFIGEGGYEGLTAIVELTRVVENSPHFLVRGVIGATDVPPAPSHPNAGP